MNVEMLGFVKNEDVRKLIANSKGMILPTQCYEGFPMSIVEAFSVGTPVICSDLGNAGSIVQDGVNGCKFKKNNEICGCVRNVNTNFENYNVLNCFYKLYTAEKNYDDLETIYAHILSGE